eukprot:SAG31_NODE_7187_length_1762_cov_1.438966_4_plen_39_part_01
MIKVQVPYKVPKFRYFNFYVGFYDLVIAATVIGINMIKV